MKKDVIFKWEFEQQKSFDMLKKVLSKKPVLQFFDVKKPILITVDSSQNGLGVAILQDNLPVA